MELAPQFRVVTTRTHLHRARDYQPAQTTAERFADALLDQAQAAVTGRGAKPFTAAELVAMFEAAERAVELAIEASVSATCGCGHAWSDHIGRMGCLEGAGEHACACRERRPEREVSWTPRRLPTTAALVRAYEDEERHFPHGGAR
jgi:hypothetical protein